MDLSEYARKDYVDQKVNYRVLKSGDTMSGNLDMGKKLVYGLPTDYPPSYSGDEAVSWVQSISLTNQYFQLALNLDGTSAMRGPLKMGNNFIENLHDPLRPQDAATKNYVDRRKPLITVWAKTKPNTPHWSFVADPPLYDEHIGYTMLYSGRVLSMGLSVFNRVNDDIRRYVIIIVNEEDKQDYHLASFSGPRTINFQDPLELAKGDVVSFKTVTDFSNFHGIATLLIELDM